MYLTPTELIEYSNEFQLKILTIKKIPEPYRKLKKQFSIIFQRRSTSKIPDFPIGRQSAPGTITLEVLKMCL